MEYQLIAENDPFKLAQLVNEACSDGWEPFGGPIVAATIKESWYHYQAIIRKTSDTKENSQNDIQQIKDSISLITEGWKILNDAAASGINCEAMSKLNAALEKLNPLI